MYYIILHVFGLTIQLGGNVVFHRPERENQLHVLHPGISEI